MVEERSAEYGLDEGVDDEEEPQRPAMSPMVSPASSLTSKASGTSRASEGGAISVTSGQSPTSVTSLVTSKRYVSVV